MENKTANQLVKAGNKIKIGFGFRGFQQSKFTLVQDFTQTGALNHLLMSCIFLSIPIHENFREASSAFDSIGFVFLEFALLRSDNFFNVIDLMFLQKYAFTPYKSSTCVKAL